MQRCLLVLFLGLLPAWAALPPQSSERLFEQAEQVLVGRVVAVRSQVVPVKAGLDRRYDLELEVESALKGAAAPGTVVTLHTRQSSVRPTGWAGPQGQNAIPEEGQRIKAYLRTSSDGKTRLLEPNGWETL